MNPKNKNPYLNLFKYTWHYSKEHHYKVVIFIILSAIGKILELFYPVVIGKIFDVLQLSGNDPRLFNKLFKWFLVFTLISLLVHFFHHYSRVIEINNAFRVRKNYKVDMFNKVVHLKAAWHRDHHTGDTIDKINRAGENLFYFSEGIFMHLNAVIKLLGSIIILTFYFKFSGLIMVIVSIILIGAIMLYDKLLIKRYKRVLKKENFLTSGLHDFISNIITVITLRIKKRALAEIDKRAKAGYPIFKKTTWMDESKWFVVSNVISFLTIFIIAYNIFYQFNTTGVILISTLFAIYKYLEKVGSAFYDFAWLYSDIVEKDTTVQAAEVISKAHQENKVPQKGSLKKDWRKIEIKNLNFKYEELNKKDFKGKRSEIQNLSFEIKRKTRIALVGHSGSGKSTVLVLLRGLYEPGQVEVIADGKVLPKGLRHLWDETTLIPQEPEIFQNTMKYNITLGISCLKKELDKVIRIARFDPVLKRLKRGLKTDVMEKGVSLSGGEKQRLALARGLFAGRDSDILLLDEPTSSVDSSNELEIYKNIFKSYKKKTILSSIHRLHLLEHFDYIYYFKQGKIIAKGSLKQILKNQDFKKLWDDYQNKR
jgi:ABC-type multidrug transport system fused ATPase/permease subunit